MKRALQYKTNVCTNAQKNCSKTVGEIHNAEVIEYDMHLEKQLSSRETILKQGGADTLKLVLQNFSMLQMFVKIFNRITAKLQKEFMTQNYLSIHIYRNG